MWPAPDASGGDDGKYGEMNSSRYRRISRWIHGLLSAAGVVPLLGVIPDAVDLIYTLAELPSGHSSGSDAALAALGVGATFAPGAGDGAAAAAKIANRALDAGEVIAKNVDELSAAGKVIDKGGELTKAGRAAQKHGSRPGSAFSPTTGNASSINEQGQNALDDILTSPNQSSKGNRFGGQDIHAPDGRGARYDKDGNFMGFLEP